MQINIQVYIHTRNGKLSVAKQDNTKLQIVDINPI